MLRGWFQLLLLSCVVWSALALPCSAQQLSLSEPCSVTDAALADRRQELFRSIDGLRSERDAIGLRAPLWVMGSALVVTTGSLYASTYVEGDARAGLTAVAAVGAVVLASSVLTLGVRRYRRGKLIRELGPLRKRANELEAIALLHGLDACSGRLDRPAALLALEQQERAARAELSTTFRPSRALFFTGAALAVVGAVTFLGLIAQGLYRLGTDQPGWQKADELLLVPVITVPVGLVTMIAASGRMQRLRRRTEPDLDHVRALHLARKRLATWDSEPPAQDEPPPPP